jgi:O-antigen ligase
VLGLIISGSTAGAIGFGLAAVVAFIVGRWRDGASRRRLAAIAALPLVVVAGLVPMRSGDVGHLLRYFGIGPKEKERNVETLVQRTLLIYIGWRIFLDHPAIGAGFESSLEQSVYTPYLADAHRNFPSSPSRAFPSPAHPYGVQNLYVQTLAETGVIGFALLLTVFVSGLAVAGRVTLRGPPELGLLAVLFLLVCIGVWNALGTIAGIPMDALTWLALGLAVAAAAQRQLQA